jgi:hypothetical protein
LVEEKCKANFEMCRLLLEEKHMRQEIVVSKKNRAMMMDPNGEDKKMRAYCEVRRAEIFQYIIP